MATSFDRKLVGYAAAVSAAALLGAHAADGAVTQMTGFTGQGGALNDPPGNLILSISDDTVKAGNIPGAPTDVGKHMYVTNKNGKDGVSYLFDGTAEKGALTNLSLIGGNVVVGPTAPGSASWESVLNGTDNDIGYLDTTTGTVYQNNQSTGATEFALNTPGYIGFKFTPTGSSAVDYGYSVFSYDNASNMTVTDFYDPTSNPVTIPLAAVPEPGSLAVLTFGRVALLRRKRVG